MPKRSTSDAVSISSETSEVVVELSDDDCWEPAEPPAKRTRHENDLGVSGCPFWEDVNQRACIIYNIAVPRPQRSLTEFENVTLALHLRALWKRVSPRYLPTLTDKSLQDSIITRLVNIAQVADSFNCDTASLVLTTTFETAKVLIISLASKDVLPLPPPIYETVVLGSSRRREDNESNATDRWIALCLYMFNPNIEDPFILLKFLRMVLWTVFYLQNGGFERLDVDLRQALVQIIPFPVSAESDWITVTASFVLLTQRLFDRGVTHPATSPAMDAHLEDIENLQKGLRLSLLSPDVVLQMEQCHAAMAKTIDWWLQKEIWATPLRMGLVHGFFLQHVSAPIAVVNELFGGRSRYPIGDMKALQKKYGENFLPIHEVFILPDFPTPAMALTVLCCMHRLWKTERSYLATEMCARILQIMCWPPYKNNNRTVQQRIYRLLVQYFAASRMDTMYCNYCTDALFLADTRNFRITDVTP